MSLHVDCHIRDSPSCGLARIDVRLSPDHPEVLPGSALAGLPFAIVEQLQQLCAAPEPRCERVAVVVAWAPGYEPALAAIAVAAVRGLVLSLGQELAPRPHLNVVVAGARPPAEVEPTLAYLAGPDGGHLTMATLDLVAA